MFGKSFNLENDEAIIAINSPKESCGGPYAVVYKNIEQYWAIVAFEWCGTPTLGIRWFDSKNGTPNSRGYPTWLVIPTELHNAVLNGLVLDFKFRDRVYRFLTGEISSDQLKAGGKK